MRVCADCDHPEHDGNFCQVKVEFGYFCNCHETDVMIALDPTSSEGGPLSPPVRTGDTLRAGHRKPGRPPAVPLYRKAPKK